MHVELFLCRFLLKRVGGRRRSLWTRWSDRWRWPRKSWTSTRRGARGSRRRTGTSCAPRLICERTVLSWSRLLIWLLMMRMRCCLSDPSVMIDEAKLINRTIVSEMATWRGVREGSRKLSFPKQNIYFADRTSPTHVHVDYQECLTYRQTDSVSALLGIIQSSSPAVNVIL